MFDYKSEAIAWSITIENLQNRLISARLSKHACDTRIIFKKNKR